MGNDLSIELGELLQLADDLEDAQRRIVPAITPAVKRGAMNIKRDAAATAESLIGGGHARLYPRSISYDITSDHESVTAEIGPDKERRQGALGNLLEFGSSNNPPYPHLYPAAEREIPKAEVQIASAAVRAMLT